MHNSSEPPSNYVELLDALATSGNFISFGSPERIVAYCLELANLRIDFDRMDDFLSRFWGVIENMEDDESGIGLTLKKFLVVYTEDNAVLRVHAYRERVFQLTNLVLAFGLPEKNVPTIERVSCLLREKGCASLPRHLELLTATKAPAIREALERRNEFVHRLPTRDWLSLGSGRLLQEWLSLDWDSGKLQDRDSADVALEALYLEKEKRDVLVFLTNIREELDFFEEGFCPLLYQTYQTGITR